MSMPELHYATLIDVCHRVKSGELSARTVTEAMLDRIDTLDVELKSYVKVLPEQALATADRLDKDRKEGRPLGALHGVPIAVKDLLYTRGVATASGTRVMRDFIPDEDATVITRLKAAGAVIIGKTQLTEGAFAAHHPEVDPPRNPWNPAFWPGVSSSGSGVAVAAGLAFGALGSDTGGSIRFPSACCGVVGIKPTYGRVSRHGAFPLAGSLDHIGPMARTVEDAALLLQVLAGEDPRDDTTLSEPVPTYAAAFAERVPGTTIGVDWNYVSSGVEDPVIDTVREALDVFAGLGAEVKEVAFPRSYRELVQGWSLTAGVECARAHSAFFPQRKAEYGPVLKALIELGLRTSQRDYDAVEAVRTRFRAALDTLLDDVDLLIAPCMPALPPAAEAMTTGGADAPSTVEFITFTAPFDYSGHPAIVLPAGLAATGLPKAFQLIGRRLGEPTLIRVASAYERALDFRLHPLP